MKAVNIIPFVMLLILAGCVGKKKGPEPFKKEKGLKGTSVTKVNIPVADDTIRSFFDEEIGEFTTLDDLSVEHVPATKDSVVYASREQEYEQEFSWIEEQDEVDKEFDVVYFDFDKHDIRADQTNALHNNIDYLLEVVQEACHDNDEPEIIVEGHSCKITRSNDYNFVLSETRAKVIADKLVEAGIPKDVIKVVGRGSQYCLIEDGTIEQQSSNRRVEIHIKPRRQA